MTGEGREQNEPGLTPEQTQPRAVVVAVDPARLELYARTLRLAEVPNLATLDLDEAEQLLIEHQPTVLVLDHGLPRVYILRLYGLVREVMEGPRVKVLFVGQEARSDADTNPEDYYLPGEPSPLGVAAQVCEMVAEADAARAEAPDDAASALVASTDASEAPAAGDDETMPGVEAVTVADGDADATTTAASPPADTPAPDEPPEAPPASDDTPAPALVGAGIAAGTAAGTPDVAGTDVSADTPGDTATTAMPEAAPAEPPRKRRFATLMFRIGLILLILGGLVAFIRPESFSLPMNVPPREAPTPVPTTPTQQPAASPSPAALLDAASVPAHVLMRQPSPLP